MKLVCKKHNRRVVVTNSGAAWHRTGNGSLCDRDYFYSVSLESLHKLSPRTRAMMSYHHHN